METTKLAIRRLREKAGLSKSQLADRMGYVPGCVTNWENGTSMPRTGDLPKLAAVLGVTVNDLFDREEGEDSA